MAKQKKKKSHGVFKNAHFIPTFEIFFFFLSAEVVAESNTEPRAPGSGGRDVLNHSSSLHAGDSELCQGHQNDSRAA